MNIHLQLHPVKISHGGKKLFKYMDVHESLNTRDRRYIKWKTWSFIMNVRKYSVLF